MYASHADLFKEAEEPDWVTAWLSKREEKAEKKEQKEKSETPVDEAAQAKRQAVRHQKVLAGIDDLQIWMKDLLRNGLLNIPERAHTLFEPISRRMIDAQAGGLAGRLRSLQEINYYTDSWKYELTDKLSKLYLLTESYKNLDSLSAEWQTEIRIQVGYPQAKEEVMSGVPVTDQWIVLHTRSRKINELRTETFWLYGKSSHRMALYLNFLAPGALPEFNLVPGGVYEGEGVCHQVMMENHVVPGELIFGADSHTCAYGALGAFGTGVGCTDYLYAMVTGTSWVMVPGTLRFNLKGKLNDGVYARDLILSIIGKIGANGANYKAMEFAGEGLHSLSMADRISICNLCVEAGAKTALMEVDDVAMDYLKEHGREPKACFTSDDDAVFEQVYDIDLSTIQPIVAKPHFVDNVVPAKESLGVKIDEAFLGSCNNGRIEDLRVGAAIIKGKKVAPKVRFLVVPASRSVYLQAMKEGLLDIFMDAGAIVMNPNCSVCWGSCQGVIGEGETLISTGTRNFKGRAGHKDSFVYLASAATVTASAIKGEIATADMV